MSIYEQLLEDIVSALNFPSTDPDHPTLHTFGVAARKLEQFRGQYKALDPLAKSRVGVSFAMHRFGTEKEPTEFLIGQNGQSSDIYVMMSVAARSQYGDGGALHLIELVTKNLIGYPCEHGGVLSGFSTELLTFVDGTWHWEMLFRVRNFMILPYTDYSVEPPIHDGFFTQFDIDSGNCERDILTGEGDLIEEGEDTVNDEI